MSIESSPQAYDIQPEQVFTEFVFKVASRCNMQPPEPGSKLLEILGDGVAGCDQCYEYVGTDEWKKQPALMSSDVMEQGAKRIAEHAEQHGISDIRILAHGGEALMASDTHIDSFFSVMRTTVEKPNTKLHLGIQTNGLLLTDRKLEILKKHDVMVGLSIDGNKEANDRHRRDRLGKSTYDRVVRAAGKLASSELSWGILTVIDPANNPEETLESLAALRPHTISMFPPHANWSSPPRFTKDAMSLGEWQVRVFERYRTWHEHHPDQPEPPFMLPLADGYMEAFMGASPLHERISNRYPHELFILPNGNFQRLDTLKSTEAGAYVMPYNVFDHSLNHIAQHDPGFAARRAGTKALADACQSCPIVKACGGDYYPLRFKQTEKPLDASSDTDHFLEAFRNRSVYCDDQKTYLGHIALFVAEQQHLANPQPVDISAAWRAATYEARKTHGIAFGGSPLKPENETTVHDVMSGIDYITQRYSSNTSGVQHDIPEIPIHLFAPTLDAIHAEHYSGRLALEALRSLVYLLRRDKDVLYFQSVTDQAKPAFNSLDKLTDNPVQAIVQALFNPNHNFLKDTDFTLRRCGQHWLVTKNAMETHARMTHVPGNAFISTATIPMEQHLMLKAGKATIDTEFLATMADSPFFLQRPTRVTIADAPGDLLVISHDKNTPAHHRDALEDVASRLPLFESPELLSASLAQEESEISLRSLAGHWPMAKKLQTYSLRHDRTYAT